MAKIINSFIKHRVFEARKYITKATKNQDEDPYQSVSIIEREEYSNNKNCDTKLTTYISGITSVSHEKFYLQEFCDHSCCIDKTVQMSIFLPST